MTFAQHRAGESSSLLESLGSDSKRRDGELEDSRVEVELKAS